MPELTFGPIREDEVPAVARILSLAFAGPREGTTDWLVKSGLQHVRVLRPSSGDPVACLLRIPMGEFFGGRSVPLIGIAGVGVAPEARGMGVAGRLMAAALQEMHAEGASISGLYPATQPLYQRVGYEQAGHRFETRLPLSAIDCREKSLAIRPVADADEPQVRACYTRFAQAHDGPLDRGEYIWSRVKTFRDTVYQGFAAVNASGGVEGYLYVNQQRRPDGRQDLQLTDLVFDNAAAGRRLLTLLEEWESIAVEISFCGGPLHPALFLLADQRYSVSLKHYWMLRIVDIRRAFESRGYPGAIRAEAHLDIHDDVIPANAGRWVVSVEGGRASVSRGGRGDVRLDARALAPLFSGYLSTLQLAQLGRIEGDPAAIIAATAVFPSGTPWLGDMY